MSQGNTQLVRLKKGKKTFEVMTNPGTVLKFRAGKGPMSDVLYAEIIFKNASKGDRASDEDLQEAFETTDIKEIGEIIVKDGELQVSAKERAEKLEAKTKEIITFVHKNFMDPKTNLPHPVARLELALKGAKFRVDPELPAKSQALDLVKKLQGTLAMKKSGIEGTVQVTHKYAGQCTGILYKFASSVKEKHVSGGMEWDIVLAPGDFDSFVAAMNKITKVYISFLVCLLRLFVELSFLLSRLPFIRLSIPFPSVSFSVLIYLGR